MSPLQETFDPLQTSFWSFQIALPHNQHLPPHTPQSSNIALVTFAVTFQLRLPKFQVTFWQAAQSTFRVVVPKAAMDENSLSSFRENDVGTTWQTLNIKAIPITGTVKCSTQYAFRRSMLPAN